MFKMMTLVTGLFLSQATLAQPSFQQGPEQVGQILQLSGKVIGVHHDLTQTCFIVLADTNRPKWEGLGGGGRFFLCQQTPTLSMGDMFNGKVVQKGTRMLRVGPRMRVTPLYWETKNE